MIIDENADENSMNMVQPADEDTLATSEGSMTCCRTKKLNKAIGGLLISWKQEKNFGQDLINQHTHHHLSYSTFKMLIIVCLNTLIIILMMIYYDTIIMKLVTYIIR